MLNVLKENLGRGRDTRQRTLAIICLTGLLFFGGGPVQADVFTVTTASGRGADAYVQGSFPTSNFGDSAVITTRDGIGNAANVYKDYFRFDLSNSGYDLANASSVTFSFVTLTARTGTGFGFYVLPDGQPGDASPATTGWTELGITYNNAPGNAASGTATGFITASPGDENGNFLNAVGTLTLDTTAGGTVSFSSASLLAAVKGNSNGLLTIALVRTDTAGIVQIASRENTGGFMFPTLQINAPNISPVPEPGVAALTGLGLGCLVFITRRRQPGR